MKLQALAIVAALAIPASAADAPDGKAIYKDKCSFCHGLAGKPLPTLAAKGVRNFSDPAWAKAATDDKLVKVIREGSEGTLMRSFAKELEPDEIAAVAAYVLELSAPAVK